MDNKFCIGCGKNLVFPSVDLCKVKLKNGYLCSCCSQYIKGKYHN